MIDAEEEELVIRRLDAVVEQRVPVGLLSDVVNIGKCSVKTYYKAIMRLTDFLS